MKINYGNVIRTCIIYNSTCVTFPVTETNPPICEISKLEILRNQLRTDMPLHDLESISDSAAIAKHVGTILDQIKHLRTAIENTIELSKIKGHKMNMSYEGNVMKVPCTIFTFRFDHIFIINTLNVKSI